STRVASRRPWLSQTRSPAVRSSAPTCPLCCGLFSATANALVSPPKSADAWRPDPETQARCRPRVRSCEQFRLAPPSQPKGAADVTENDHDQTSDDVTRETTSASPPPNFPNDPDALPTVGADSAVSGVEA